MLAKPLEVIEEAFAKLTFGAISLGQRRIFPAPLISPAVEALETAVKFAHVKVGRVYVLGIGYLRKLLRVEPCRRMYFPVGKIVIQHKVPRNDNMELHKFAVSLEMSSAQHNVRIFHAGRMVGSAISQRTQGIRIEIHCGIAHENSKLVLRIADILL